MGRLAGSALRLRPLRLQRNLQRLAQEGKGGRVLELRRYRRVAQQVLQEGGGRAERGGGGR